jgi:hypothetical protein
VRRSGSATSSWSESTSGTTNHSITLDVYSKTWWNERVEAVSRVVEAVFTEPDKEDERRKEAPLR